MKNFWCWMILAAAMAFANANVAAVLQVDANGKLSGATGVDVSGARFDVRFRDGTCIALFSGCDAASDFAFQTEPSAIAAAQALLDQVFLDGPAGQFDSVPALTRGCGPFLGFALCDVLIPSAVLNDKTTGTIASNAAPGIPSTPDHVSIYGGLLNDMDLGEDDPFRTFAVFRPQAAIPEPGTIASLGVGLLALVLTRRRYGPTRKPLAVTYC
jgi:PEP-CTERM motif